MITSDDLYERLEVTRKATAEEIKEAFRRLAKEHHPDVGGNADDFRKIQEAFFVLGDDVKKGIYDKTGCKGNAIHYTASEMELVGLFNLEIASKDEIRDELRFNDPIEFMRIELDKKLIDIRNKQKILDKKRDILSVLEKKFIRKTTDTGRDIFKDHFIELRKEIENVKASNERVMVIVTEARRIVMEYHEKETVYLFSKSKDTGLTHTANAVRSI